VRRLDCGNYIFLGRTDYQVKVLGHRVELGEVEAALRQDPSVEHAVALPWPFGRTSVDSLVACVSGNDVNEAQLIERSKAVLPPYAVPHKLYGGASSMRSTATAVCGITANVRRARGAFRWRI
jgi:acyl-coenzyme A synthetase/AMP-(fatty) acid ligase